MIKPILNFKHFCALLLLFWFQLGAAQVDIPIQQELPLNKRWASLNKVLAKKKIVALGENFHGVREYNRIKLEMIQYLHEQMGFNVLAIESDLAMNYFANAYRDQIDDTLILKQAVTPVWHTQHHLELIAYLKAHPQLQLIGFDMLTKRPVAFFAKALGIDIDSSQAQFQTFLNDYPQWEEVNGNHAAYSGEKRDSVMAAIVVWIAEQLYPNEKIILSAHNFHIANQKYEGRECMGHLLQQQYKKNYYSIGFYNSLGSPVHIFRDMPFRHYRKDLPENCLQYKFLQKKGNQLFIPISGQRKTKTNKWMHQEVQQFSHSKYIQDPLILSKFFDGIIWVRTVTAPRFVIKSKAHNPMSKFLE
jgi:erythromycin esterase